MTGEIGRRNNLGVPHLVVYGTTDELQHVIAPSLEDAMVYAEYLANERDEQCFRVFELREVDMAIKRYYQVSLVGSDAPASAVDSSTIAPPPGVAELAIVPEPGVDWPAPAAADASEPDAVDTAEVGDQPDPLASPVRIVELDEMAAATADVAASVVPSELLVDGDDQGPGDRWDHDLEAGPAGEVVDPAASADATVEGFDPDEADDVDARSSYLDDGAMDGVEDDGVGDAVDEVDDGAAEGATSKVMRISA